MESKMTLASIFKQYGTGNKLTIDIGCGDGGDLFNLEEAGFEKLIGIDRKAGEQKYFQNYFNILINKDRSAFMRRKQLEEEFKAKFIFHGGEIKNYNFENNRYNCILCHMFLHFLPFEEQKPFIERLHNLLEPGGLMFIRINHNKHPRNIDAKQSKQIAKDVYQSLTEPDNIQYLVEADEFIAYMKGKYDIIPKQWVFKTDEFIGVIIKK